ncbi:MAG: nicotinate-nicotinamide nucleotide adenylyltransferase, partial [Bryobacteraceae bacterium]
MARGKRLRLGIFGGTFDPVHQGHLILACDALEQARLDAVLFIPCAQSPHKSGRPHTTDAQRVAMLKKALKDETRFWLSRCELERGAPSYAIDTVREISEAFPRAELFWL